MGVKNKYSRAVNGFWEGGNSDLRLGFLLEGSGIRDIVILSQRFYTENEGK
jgi:hypothetical protein